MRHLFSGRRDGGFRIRDGELAVVRRRHGWCRAVGQVAPQQRTADRGLDLVGDVAAQRPGAVDRVEAVFGDEPAGRLGELEGDPPLGQPLAQLVELQVDDPLDLVAG